MTWYQAPEGKKTAFGKGFMSELPCAAHHTLPYRTVVAMRHVGDLEPMGSHMIMINDRIPKTTIADFDLTPYAFRFFAPLKVGVLELEWRILYLPK